MTTDGDMLALSSQGASLASKERASTSGVQMVLQSCGGDASRSASPVADSNARQVFSRTVGYQGSVNPPRPRFYVELKEGETTIVSWKEIIKGSQTFACEDPTSVSPSHVAPPTEKATSADVFQVPANRFSSVIADIGRGIEQLYKGVDSEEEDDEYVCMDEYYDTKDSFIDDTELDDYFQVDTIKPKHTGFFVSKRTLEQVDESPPCLPLQPLAPPPVHLQKKRKRNITKHSREMGEIPKQNVKVSLALTEATSETPRPIATVVKTTGSILKKTCEQSVIPKPKKRVKPVRSLTGSSLVKTSEESVMPNPKKRMKSVLSKRDSYAENTTRLSSDCATRENENVQELEEEQAEDGRLQDMKPRTIYLVNSGVATCLGVDAEQLDGPYDLQETLGSIDNTGLGSHGLQNAVCPAKERRKKQKLVKMGEQYFRKKDDSNIESKTERETASMGRKRPAPSRPTIVPLLNKGVPQKERQIVKASKQREDGTSKDKTKQKRNYDAALWRRLSVEDARRILVGVGTKHGMKFAKKMRSTLPKTLQPESTE